MQMAAAQLMRIPLLNVEIILCKIEDNHKDGALLRGMQNISASRGLPKQNALL